MWQTIDSTYQPCANVDRETTELVNLKDQSMYAQEEML